MNPDNAAMIPAKTSTETLLLRHLACAGCGSPFECGTGGRDGGCWCMDEVSRLPMPEQNGGDCLCPACLRAAVAGRSAGLSA